MKFFAFTGKAVHFTARVRKWWAASCLGLLMLPGIGKFGGASAQAPEPPLPPKSYMNKTTFFLPVIIDDKVRGSLREIQLYEKDHPSRPWILKDRKGPLINTFEFRPPHDGEYWFTVVTVDKLGRQMPADVTREGPGVIVVHDTQAPQVDIRQLQATADGQWVQCEVRDNNADPARTRFEYQTTDQIWRAGEATPGRGDTFVIPAQANFNGMVKVTAVDRAGNTTEQKLNLNVTAGNLNVPTAPAPCPSGTNCQPPRVIPSAVNTQAQAMPGTGPELSPPVAPSCGPQRHQVQRIAAQPTMRPQPALAVIQAGGVGAVSTVQVVTEPPVAPTIAAPAERGTAVPTNRKIISSTHVALEYQIEQAGASGVGKVEVYVTPDQGQSWQRLGEDSDRRTPVEVDLPGEGLYGVSLIVSNGRGFGATPPASGDAPDWWIEVDVTKPFVELTSVRPGSGDEGAALWVTWTARDKNLANEPVDLYYSVNREGPWQPIAKGIRNDGRYRWAVPQEVGPLAFVRVVVTDKAGNSSKSDTPQAVALDDMSRPRARVVGIAPPNAPVVPPTGH